MTMTMTTTNQMDTNTNNNTNTHLVRNCTWTVADLTSTVISCHIRVAAAFLARATAALVASDLTAVAVQDQVA